MQEASTQAPCSISRSVRRSGLAGRGKGAGAKPAARATATSSVRVRMGDTPVEFIVKNMTRKSRDEVAYTNYTLEECIRRYPYSTAAGSAKLELKRIKY